MRLVRIALCAISFAATSSFAATFDGDRLRMCGRTFEIAAELQPSVFFEAVSADLERLRYDLVFVALAQTAASAMPAPVRTGADVARFIDAIRAGRLGPTAFDVVPSDDRTQEVVFENTATPIAFDCASLAGHQPDLAAAALLARWVKAQSMLGALGDRAKFVARQSQEHENLLKNGLPMWPWELWLNGKRLGPSDWEPLFRTQWVLLRPTVGVEVNTRSQAAANLEASVAVEPIGFVRYRDDQYASWWGASLLVTASTRQGMGLGGLLRYGNYALGITRHKSETAGKPDSWFLFLGMDLYDKVNSKRDEFETWREQQRRRVDEVLKGN